MACSGITYWIGPICMWYRFYHRNFYAFFIGSSPLSEAFTLKWLLQYALKRLMNLARDTARPRKQNCTLDSTTGRSNTSVHCPSLPCISSSYPQSWRILHPHLNVRQLSTVGSIIFYPKSFHTPAAFFKVTLCMALPWLVRIHIQQQYQFLTSQKWIQCLFGGLEDGIEEVSAFLISLCVFTPMYIWCCCCLYIAAISGVQICVKVGHNV